MLVDTSNEAVEWNGLSIEITKEYQEYVTIFEADPFSKETSTKEEKVMESYGSFRKIEYIVFFSEWFLFNHSCKSQLLFTVEDLARNLDSGLQTDVLILDFKKAFDTVPHQRLICKLDFYGMRGTILTWLTK